MRRAVLLALSDDAGVGEIARDRGLTVVSLVDTSFWVPSTDEPVVVDGRGRHDDAVALIESLPRDAHVPRVLVTDRESPRDHQSAWLAGATEVVVLAANEPFALEIFSRVESD